MAGGFELPTIAGWQPRGAGAPKVRRSVAPMAKPRRYEMKVHYTIDVTDPAFGTRAATRSTTGTSDRTRHYRLSLPLAEHGLTSDDRSGHVADAQVVPAGVPTHRGEGGLRGDPQLGGHEPFGLLDRDT